MIFPQNDSREDSKLNYCVRPRNALKLRKRLRRQLRNLKSQLRQLKGSTLAHRISTKLLRSLNENGLAVGLPPPPPQVRQQEVVLPQ